MRKCLPLKNLALQGLFWLSKDLDEGVDFTNRTGSEGNSDNEKFYGA